MFASLLTFSSCNEALDVAPDGRLSLDEVFQETDLTKAYFSTCFDYLVPALHMPHPATVPPPTSISTFAETWVTPTQKEDTGSYTGGKSVLSTHSFNGQPPPPYQAKATVTVG